MALVDDAPLGYFSRDHLIGSASASAKGPTARLIAARALCSCMCAHFDVCAHSAAMRAPGHGQDLDRRGV
jgi:hypothetical protein